MRSEVTTLMSPKDEENFLEFVFQNPDVYLIPKVRNPTPKVRGLRSLEGVASTHCMLWNKEILSNPEVEYISSCNDYYLRSDESLIQFLRSPIKDRRITNGRIALATGWKGAPDTDPNTAPRVTAWYKSLRKWIQSNFLNSFVYASDFVREVGSMENRVWVGRDAVQLSKKGWALKHVGPPEFSLRYYRPEDREEVAARYRAPRRLLVTGRVQALGATTSKMMNKRSYDLHLDFAVGGDLPFSRFEGVFMASRPEPKVGDEVACTFSENIFGRVPEPWEPSEIKKLLPKSREKTLNSLQKRWLA